MKRRIFIIGNSHLRSLNNDDLFTPIFLGPASKVSLLGEHIKTLYTQLNKFFSSDILKHNDDLYLFFGEGCVRYSLNNSFYPHKIGIPNYEKLYNEHKDIKTNNIIEECIERYITLYNYVKMKHNNTKIISCVSSFYPITPKLKYFNDNIQDKCKEFIDIFKFTLHDDKYHIKDEFLNFNFKHETKYPQYKSYKYDPIHLSNSLCNTLKESIVDIQNVVSFHSNQYTRDSNYKCIIIK